MNYKEAKDKFISTWGVLGSSWGINKAMAQIHALLWISPEPLSMEDIMEELQISRGNTSMNLRQLIDWGIVYKESKAGDRKEYFASEKEVQELARQVAKERSKREIKPVIRVLKEVSSIKDDKSEKTKELIKQTAALYDLVGSMDKMIEIKKFRANFQLFLKIQKYENILKSNSLYKYYCDNHIMYIFFKRGCKFYVIYNDTSYMSTIFSLCIINLSRQY